MRRGFKSPSDHHKSEEPQQWGSFHFRSPCPPLSRGRFPCPGATAGVVRSESTVGEGFSPPFRRCGANKASVGDGFSRPSARKKIDCGCGFGRPKGRPYGEIPCFGRAKGRPYGEIPCFGRAKARPYGGNLAKTAAVEVSSTAGAHARNLTGLLFGAS